MLSILLLIGLSAVDPPPTRDTSAVQAAIRAGVAAATHPWMQWGDIRDVHQTLNAMYARREWRPLWIGPAGATRSAQLVIAGIAAVDRYGLPASDFDAGWLAARAALAAAATPADMAAFDITLSTAAARVTMALHAGRIDPRQWYPSLHREPDRFNVGVLLDELGGGISPDSVWRAVQPKHPAYWRLLDLLARVRSQAADAPALSANEFPARLRPGDAFPAAPDLRTVLELLGEYRGPASSRSDTTYDAELVAAVRSFQQHQALLADGIIGPETRAPLLTPLRERIRQIELTLERWRWLPIPLDASVVVVNVPAFRLGAYRVDASGTPDTVAMDVIAGRYPDWKTPMLSTKILGVLVRPPWVVPASIAIEEVRPHALKDPQYLAREGFELLQHDTVVPPTPGNIRGIGTTVVARQRPGPRNPLGRLKLEMPNTANVYLHDTPARALFAKPERAFSHGCVRVANASGLARFLFAGQTDSVRQAFEHAVRSDTTLLVSLARPVAAMIVYHTVEVDARGVPAFHRDVYHADETLDAALKRGYPFRAAEVSASRTTECSGAGFP